MKTIKELYFEVRELAGAGEFDRRIRNWLGSYRRSLVRAGDGRRETGDERKAVCQAVLDDLNSLLGSRYTLLKQYEDMIVYWLRLGKTLDDFKKVHRVKYSQWFDNRDFKSNLRPSTLYRKSHFDEYLQEAHVLATTKKAKIFSPQRAQSTQSESKENHAFVMDRIRLLGDLAKAVDPVKRKRLQDELKALDQKRG